MQLALLTAPLRYSLAIASSRKDDGPKVNTVHELPVVHLLIRLLQNN